MMADKRKLETEAVVHLARDWATKGDWKRRMGACEALLAIERDDLSDEIETAYRMRRQSMEVQEGC